jgi:hypothetical protein
VLSAGPAASYARYLFMLFAAHNRRPIEDGPDVGIIGTAPTPLTPLQLVLGGAQHRRFRKANYPRSCLLPSDIVGIANALLVLGRWIGACLKISAFAILLPLLH